MFSSSSIYTVIIHASIHLGILLIKFFHNLTDDLDVCATSYKTDDL